MSRLEHAAIDLHQLIWNNVGSTEDWPIMLRLDEEIHDEVVNALNELSEAVREVDPELVPWPITLDKPYEGD